MLLIEQITLNTSELANWFIGAVISAFCVLLYNLLRKLESNQEKHANKLEEHGLKLVEHTGKIENLEEKLK